MEPLSIAIIGASGYTGEELVRLALRHPHLHLTTVTSRQLTGQPLAHHIPALPTSTSLTFTAPDLPSLIPTAQLFLLALPHGQAAQYAVPLLQAGKIVIDLSADFRLRDPHTYHTTYGHPHPAPHLLSQACYALPEIRRHTIPHHNLLAAPGCYPTSILLPLIPILQARLIDPTTITITSASGASGAGKKTEIPYLFCEINETFRAYGLPHHRHLPEIEQELSLAAQTPIHLTFIPHIGPWHRGIWTTITATLAPSITPEHLQTTYHQAYAQEPFIRVSQASHLMPDMRNVQRTNRIEIAWHIDSRTSRLILFSTIDNLGKGAASQAIQILNCHRHWPETTGLQ
jgi:N-acetyl-gamma-glutamyl-phosphate reductase